MRRFGVLFCLAALMGLAASQASAQQAMEDVIYLKDGSILRGIIIEQIPGKSLKIQMRDGNIFVYDIDKVERMTREPAVGGQKLAVHKKNPGTAFALSFFVPGAGQVYNGERVKGAVQFMGFAVGAILVLGQIDERVSLWRSDSETITRWSKLLHLAVGGMLWLGSSLWSMIDAPISASRINREEQSAHLFQMNAGRFVVGADPVFRRNGAGGALTIRF